METKIYNADESQRVPMALVIGGERYDVTFKFKPLLDEEVIRLSDEQTDSAKFFERHIQAAEGCADENEQEFSPEELAELIPKADQEYAVDAALLGTRLLAAPTAGRKLNLRKPSPTSKYKLAAWFQNDEVITEHVMANESPEVGRVWRAIESRSFPITFGDIQIKSYGRGLVALYDALVERSEGYADRVPAHHKMIVIAAHLRGRREILLGK